MKRSGFTLIEVVVSLAIVSVIGVALYGTVGRSFSMREEIAAHSERYRQAYVALERISRELAQAFVSNHVNKADVSTQTGFYGEEDEILFTSFSNTVLRKDAYAGDQETIRYRLGQDPTGGDGTCLMRWSAPRVLEDIEQEDEGRERVLICGVDRIELKYHAEREDDWSDSWRTEDIAHKDVDDGEVRARLPDRVRMSLWVEMPDGSKRLFRTATTLRLTKALNF